MLAHRDAPQLIIWPEAALPFYYQDGHALADRVTALPPKAGAALLFGSPAYRQEPGGRRYLNSAFLLDRDGTVRGRSDKIRLVPFGEYVPVKRFLPFIDKLVVGIGDFSPGTINPLPLNGHRLGVLICYEAIFPELAREWVRQGSSLLVNITNDAWFGRSSAPWQHLAMVRFVMVTNAGGGYSRWGNFEITRWRSDRTRDPWGAFCYIHEADPDRLWSNVYHPIGGKVEAYSVNFALDRAVFRRAHLASAPEQNLLNARIGLTNGNMRLEFFGNNLTDEDAYAAAGRWSDFSIPGNFNFPANQGVVVTPQRPRYFGLKVSYTF